MKKIFFMLLALFSSSSHAEVFKCLLASGKTVYQSTPCQSAVKQEAIDIQKSDPRKVAEEEAKLKAWQEDFAKREEARIEAEKELQAELDRKAALDALQKNADYQRQQAYEAKRQADALEQRNMQSPYPQYQFYPTPGYQSLPLYPSHLPHRHHVKEKAYTPQSGPPGPDKGHDHGNGRAKIMFKWK